MSGRAPATAADEDEWAKARRMAAREIMRRLVAHVANGTTDLADAPMPLAKEVYTDPARFEAEREKLFLGQPIVAGLSGDIPRPGDFMLFDSAGPSIIVTRGRDGRVRAVLNMCTHRGAKLVEQAEPFHGHVARHICPFHAWTFDSAGKLVGQPSKAAFGGCEIGARDLIELPTMEWGGLIFVRPGGGEPIDVEAHLGDFADQIRMLELGRAEPVKRGILHADANWKFALDTYGESYHFRMLHNSTIGQTFYSDVGSLQSYGRHHRINFPDNGYADLVGREESEWPWADYSAVHYLFPNTVIFFGSITPGTFYTQLFRLFPDGVGKTRCQFAVYAPFGIHSEEYRQVCEMAYDATAEVVQTEDYRVASAGYANMLSAPEGYRAVLGANEIAVQAVQKHIAAAIGMSLE